MFEDLAEREGAYRLRGNRAVPADSLTRAMSDSCAERCAAYETLYVALDGSSLALRDREDLREIGGVGCWSQHGRGLHVLTALAVEASGTPIGVCVQTWWARESRSTARLRAHFVQQNETRFFVETLEAARSRLSELAPETRPVFVMDRGFDWWPILQKAAQGVSLIVRAEYHRRLVPATARSPRLLRDALESAKPFGHYDVEVPERHDRPARVARTSLRTRRVTIVLKVGRK